VQTTIPSYLYWEYSDDSDLQAFVRAYNEMTQQYVDSFNALNLSIYTDDLISGDLLDWIAAGIYGQMRPVLTSGVTKYLGLYNTQPYNKQAFNALTLVGPGPFFATTDDVFKRIMTWNLYRGDGQIFSVRWLKRRIMRFLIGTNGTAPNIDQTDQISVSFGTNNQVNIRVLNGVRKVTGGTFNSLPFNKIALNAINSTFQQFSGFDFSASLQAAIQSGAVQLPFQYTFTFTY
jgi:hypothetical protein